MYPVSRRADTLVSSARADELQWGSRGGSRRRSSQTAPATAALLATFDTSVQQIRDWVSAEVEMLRAQAVVVGDVDEILSQLDKQKGVLRELEQKKPQLDELLHTAESLKGTENRQQLHGKESHQTFGKQSCRGQRPQMATFESRSDQIIFVI
ncbi:unnamed protein product [Pieris macdunnoughi]|uniref:Uncharacterized protein n=1 Tax=Pieris macdunnoughi TaxID=345717 RepID=A0A821TXV0_9NEOP|nr:unnamed protein product [Pieris macdunnoughi]